MKPLILLLLALWIINPFVKAQDNFYYDVQLKPVSFPGVPGIHSYASAQHAGKWLIIGGRRDGIHARQPFRSFPEAFNNTEIYVIDINAKKIWSAPLSLLPASIGEQLQSTNMNYFQDHDTLYIAGGYAYSETEDDHISFPHLTSVRVSSLINAIVNGNSISSHFKQITNEIFAVTGGEMGKIGDEFYLVGGHRFDGRYNPMGHNTFIQTYTNQVRKFRINNSDDGLVVSGYTAITDPVHLRRRDYNLIPRIFPDGSEGYTISSGVFQLNEDLPYLYPVDIHEGGYTPITTFNQYLSNYHCAHASLYDSSTKTMHTLFFGGISQYFYRDGQLTEDRKVPFVKTISRLTRLPDGSFKEYLVPTEMPALQGAGAEFFSLYPNTPEITRLGAGSADTIFIGHIYGGINSMYTHAFTNNNTPSTTADNVIYEVRLVKKQNAQGIPVEGSNPFNIEIFPNPAHSFIKVKYQLEYSTQVNYFITNVPGQILKEGAFTNLQEGSHIETIPLSEPRTKEILFLTVVFDNKFYVTKKIF